MCSTEHGLVLTALVLWQDAPVSNMRRSDRLHDTVEMFDLIHQLSPMSHSTSEAIRYGRWNHAEKRNFRAAVAEKNGGT